MATFETKITIEGYGYRVLDTYEDGVAARSFAGFDELVAHLRLRLPIYPVHGSSPSSKAPEPINNQPIDVPLGLPSRFQIGDPVHLAATVTGVTFREGQVNYETQVGTTDELDMGPTQFVRAYDVTPRTMHMVGGEWR